MDLAAPAKICSEPRAAPAPWADRFPLCPVSWYLFCSSSELRDKPITKQLLGREVVAFRTAGGQIVLLDARCSHQGADLGRGRVVGETIECPFHSWRYGPNGRCVRIPAQAGIPAFARQTCYAAAERHGYVYLFNGAEPLFPLPFFMEESPDAFIAGRRLRFVAECSWQMLASNNCDLQHWNTLHDRKLLSPPVLDHPHKYARHNRFEAQVVGASIFDRCLRRFAGDPVRVSITNWGGVFFVVTGTFRRIQSRMLISVQPLDANRRVTIDVIVFVKRWRFRPVGIVAERLSLWCRRLFTSAFMAEELHQLAGIRYSPETLIESDREIIEFFHWAAALPGSPDEHGLSAPTETDSAGDVVEHAAAR